MIRDRAESLSNEPNPDRLIQKTKVLATLIQCQETLDAITDAKPERQNKVTNIGEISVKIRPGEEPGTSGCRVPKEPRDPVLTGRELAKQIKRELRKRRD